MPVLKLCLCSRVRAAVCRIRCIASGLETPSPTVRRSGGEHKRRRSKEEAEMKLRQGSCRIEHRDPINSIVVRVQGKRPRPQQPCRLLFSDSIIPDLPSQSTPVAFLFRLQALIAPVSYETSPVQNH